MDGILICGGLLIAIVLLRQRGQEWDSVAYAPVRVNTDDSTTDAICGNSLSLLNRSAFSSDDDWPTSSASDGSSISIGYESDTSRWTDPTYAYEPDIIYHGTLIDPTYHDDSFSSSDDSCSASSFDDSFSNSSSISDDSWSSSSSDDSFSSCGSFDD